MSSDAAVCVPSDLACVSAMSAAEAQQVPIKATLIVAPATLLEQWQEEFMIHVEQNTLRV